MGGFYLFSDVAKYGRTYNRPVELTGRQNPCVGAGNEAVLAICVDTLIDMDVSYRNELIVLSLTEFAYWPPNIESMEVNSESNPLERKDAEGSSLDESLENEEHLDVDSCDSDSPKNNLDDDGSERFFLGVHSQGDCGKVTTNDNEDVTQVIAPERRPPSLPPPSTPPGNDLKYVLSSLVLHGLIILVISN
ncbi:hypothetical protein Tco_1055742 [Tanacetum coccineum]|uniref:Uncharacterized protein n=1 Tax=Tanacetum coccineum TaxID=301880 RepID=A0ABQ5H163_9ASTR